MKTRGVKVLDPVLETGQLDWLMLSTAQCPDAAAERRVIAAYFRVPHEPWGADRAFVLPVLIRRSRRRVLFYQVSGLDLGPRRLPHADTPHPHFFKGSRLAAYTETSGTT
jgi:hypothetical protein